MPSLIDLKLRMYITLALIFGLGFAIIYAILYLLGVSFLGILIFVVLFFVFQWYVSPYMISASARLKYLKPGEMNELQETVKELAAKAHVPMPRIAISPSKEPNAFVFGRTRRSATLVVNEGLLNMLNKDELESVIGHELGHVKHNDFLVMTIASFIPMLAYMLAQNMMFANTGGSRNGDYALLIGFLGFAVYFISELLILGLSRSREYFADMHSAQLTKKPEHLASSLVKITYSLAESPVQQSSGSIRSFYIADSFNAKEDIEKIEKHASELKELLPELDIKRFKELASREGRNVLSLFSTHPPTYKRVIALASLKKEIEKEK
ncbi:MAG: zinc metalloprotease HtpX [Candidatus Micrarchaeota archaeon]